MFCCFVFQIMWFITRKHQKEVLFFEDRYKLSHTQGIKAPFTADLFTCIVKFPVENSRNNRTRNLSLVSS